MLFLCACRGGSALRPPMVGRSKSRKIKFGDSALAAEICACPHNRLLRRQHCSSLCSQSEGHEHVANMTSAPGHDFVVFSARAWPLQYSSPSLCEQSELQCFASGLRCMFARHPLQRCRNRHTILSKNHAEISLNFEHPTFGRFRFMQEQRQGANGKRRPLVFRCCRVLYPSPSVCKKRFAKIKILYI